MDVIGGFGGTGGIGGVIDLDAAQLVAQRGAELVVVGLRFGGLGRAGGDDAENLGAGLLLGSLDQIAGFAPQGNAVDVGFGGDVVERAGTERTGAEELFTGGVEALGEGRVLPVVDASIVPLANDFDAVGADMGPQVDGGAAAFLLGLVDFGHVNLLPVDFCEKRKGEDITLPQVSLL